MRALKTNEVAQLLRSKGYGNRISMKIPENKWGANRIFVDASQDYNKVELWKATQDEELERHYILTPVLNYRKMKSAEKKELQVFFESLPNLI